MLARLAARPTAALPRSPIPRGHRAGTPSARSLIRIFALCLTLAACEGHRPSPDGAVPDYDTSRLQRESLAVSAGEETSTHDYYVFPSKTPNAPPVILLHELPGLSAKTLIFAEFLSRRLTVYVPLLFGAPNQESLLAGLRDFAFDGEWRRRDDLAGERRIERWLSAFAERVAKAHPGQSMGALGMCLTGALSLSLLRQPQVKAVVVSQPTLPIFGADEDLDLPEAVWNLAKARAARGEIQVYGTRFEHDDMAKRAKHLRLKRELGAAFLDREIGDAEYLFDDGHGRTARIAASAHSALVFEWRPDLPDTHPVNVRRNEVRQFLAERLTAAP